jgi:predicted DCC family thiol-disulfide oxidoreductase YuxK
MTTVIAAEQECYKFRFPCMASPILFYDGTCGLCNRFVRFVLRRDRGTIFRFASLQNSFSTTILSRHNLGSGALETIYVIVDLGMPNERLLARSDAVLFVLKQVQIMGRVSGFLAGLIPRSALDSLYDFVARHRYQIFGRQEICISPSPEFRDRFLDL